MIPLQAGASGSSHLPWALPEDLHAVAKIKRLAGERVRYAGRGRAVVYSKAASSIFVRGRRASSIAASAAGRKRGSGRGGRLSNATGKLRRAKRNAMTKADATGNGSNAGNRQNQRQLTNPRR